MRIGRIGRMAAPEHPNRTDTERAVPLFRYEVPRVSVDLLSDDFTGREKLTILRYLSLEEALSGLGSQRFTSTTQDNIPLQPVRDWVRKNWEGQFAYDFSRRTVPITFRASLALSLFTTRITEHLDQVGSVEIYGSKSVQETFERHKIPSPVGLDRVDYTKLPAELKGELVTSLIDQANAAQMVASANLLFPGGVDRTTLIMVDPSFIFSTLGASKAEVVHFDRIHELDVQAKAAEVSIKNYQAVKGVSKLRQTAEPPVKTNEERYHTKARDAVDLDPFEEPAPRDVHYDPGTSFLKVFPYKEGETSDDVMRAFRRMTGGRYYSGRVDERHRGEYLGVHIAPDGRLVGYYGYNDIGFGSTDQQTIDMLSDHLEYENIEHNRRRTITDLVADLRDEIDTNKKALELAKSEHGQTSFTVERAFITALTSRGFVEATPSEIEEDQRLVKEAKKTIGIVVDAPKGQVEPTNLVAYSDKSVDERVLDLDYRILRAIVERYDLDFSGITTLAMGQRLERDNLGEWFEGCSGLLSRFKSVLVGTPELFSVLGIEPTNDEGDIKKAYRAIAAKTHPDTTPNLPSDEKVEATERFLKVTAAYRDIRSRIGTIDPNMEAPTFYLGRISEVFNTDL